jgi:RNA polymerase primary sigma factor
MLKQAAKRPTSLNAPVYEDDSGEYSDLIGDERAVDPYEALDSKTMHGELEDLLEILDEREHRIIGARFGLDGRKPMTLEQVGVEFGVTRERIRQLQNIALAKMRKSLHRKEEPMPDPASATLAKVS